LMAIPCYHQLWFGIILYLIHLRIQFLCLNLVSIRYVELLTLVTSFELLNVSLKSYNICTHLLCHLIIVFLCTFNKVCGSYDSTASTCYEGMMKSYIGESYVLETGNAQLVNISAYLNYFREDIHLKYILFPYLFPMSNPCVMMLLVTVLRNLLTTTIHIFLLFWCAHFFILISWWGS
jgi:hypothetical protein